jgi:dTDP-4-dehydrorhamnose reductase
MNIKYIIIGKNGQLGSAFCNALKDEYIAFSHREFDFSAYDNITEAFKHIPAKIVINCSAYTNVDQAEVEIDEAFKANATIPKNLAKYCLDHNLIFVHYSTDYVFKGSGQVLHNEESPTSPLNIYGKSKLAGEKAIVETGGKYLIFRTSWVYDINSANFFNKMLKLANEHEELSIVADQIGAPSYCEDIVNNTLLAIYKADNMINFPFGIYHLCNSGKTNWYEYANKIFELARQHNINLKVKKTYPITTSQFPTAAKRPLNSRLDCSKAKSILNIQMPNWLDSLEKSIKKKYENN